MVQKVMMISKEMYIDLKKNYSYKELIKERERLFSEIHDFEIMEINESCSMEEFCHPAPNVRYQMNMEYLSE